jgi:inner membrane protein
MGLMGGLAILPDLDYVGVVMGLEYTGHYGHRGYSHSALFALAIAGVAYMVARKWGTRPGFTALLAFLAVISHGLLDSMTYRTRGVPFFWPLTEYRVTFGWRPIPPAPVGARFLSQRGLEVALVEMVYFLPLTLMAFSPRLATWKRWLLRRPEPAPMLLAAAASGGSSGVAMAIPATAPSSAPVAARVPGVGPFGLQAVARVAALAAIVTASMALAQFYLHDSRLVSWIEQRTQREVAVSLKHMPQFRHLH